MTHERKKINKRFPTISKKSGGQDLKEIIIIPRKILDCNISKPECPSLGTSKTSYLIIRWRNAVGHRKRKDYETIAKNKS